MARRSIAAISTCVGVFFLPRTSGFYCPTSTVNVGLTARRCQEVNKLAASPMDKFMSGLADMMSPQQPSGDQPDRLSEGFAEDLGLEQLKQRDVARFREGLINQARKDNFKKQQDFTGYDMFDLIVDKFDVPYDVTINKTVFAGKPVLCLNVMWKYLGQSSFHLSEQAYMEHLEALAQLLKEWDRVEHFKTVLKQTKKKPNPYFGYAVALPLDLAPDTLADYFEDSYFD